MTATAEHAISMARDILGGEARAAWTADWPHVMASGIVELVEERDAARDVLRDVVGDFDRRRANPWGRFLLWLLRRTT